MLALAIILSVLLLLALLRVGVIAEYNDEGMALWLKAGFLRFRLETGEDKRKPRRKLELGSIKPGSLREFMDIFGVFRNMLGRLRRRLLIKRLTLYYTSGGEDPSMVALQFGAANAVFGVIMPVLERHFRIKRRDLRTSADFDLKEPRIYALISISIAIWEAIYVLLALLPMITTKPSNRKDGTINGKGTNKQPT